LEERLRDMPKPEEKRFDKLKLVKWLKRKSFKKKAFIVASIVILVVALLVAAVVLIMIFSNKTDPNIKQAQTVIATSTAYTGSSYFSSTGQSTSTTTSRI
jgi:flagellar basal body-associated protein FliL